MLLPQSYSSKLFQFQKILENSVHQTFSLFQKVYILRKSRLGFFKMVKITKDIFVPTRF